MDVLLPKIPILIEFVYYDQDNIFPFDFGSPSIKSIMIFFQIPYEIDNG
jgi:hypothetical protein